MKSILESGILAFSTLLLCLTSVACDSDVTEARFMASWSPDGTLAALVSSFPDEKAAESSIWIFDTASQETRRIVEFPAGLACIHPQWSPYDDHLLFGVIDMRKETSQDEDGLVAYSVWMVGADGKGLRKVAESTARESTILQPNAINWTDVSGEVLFQRVIDGKLHARLRDLNDRHESDYLPEPVDGYLFEPSPDRTLTAALLFNYSASTAKLCLRDRVSRQWQLTDTLDYDLERLNGLAQMMLWSPDSSRLIVAGAEKRANPSKPAKHVLRLYDLVTGKSLSLKLEASGDPICWNADSSAFFVSLRGQTARGAGIYRVDAATGKPTAILREPKAHLLSLNSLDQRIYLLRAFEAEESDNDAQSAETATYSQIFSCGLDGSDVEEIGRLDSADLHLSVSPNGSCLLLFTDNHSKASLDLRLGQLHDLKLQDRGDHPVRR